MKFEVGEEVYCRGKVLWKGRIVKIDGDYFEIQMPSTLVLGFNRDELRKPTPALERELNAQHGRTLQDLRDGNDS